MDILMKQWFSDCSVAKWMYAKYRTARNATQMAIMQVKQTVRFVGQVSLSQWWIPNVAMSFFLFQIFDANSFRQKKVFVDVEALSLHRHDRIGY